jgi:WhiB family redox-sensing transcriptional regulator
MSGPPRQFGTRGLPQPEWVTDAACRRPGVSRNDFYPEQKQDPTAATHRAKNVCAPCPVRGDCLRYGDAISPLWGIFGGLTAGERRARRAQAKDVAA